MAQAREPGVHARGASRTSSRGSASSRCAVLDAAPGGRGVRRGGGAHRAVPGPGHRRAARCGRRRPRRLPPLVRRHDRGARHARTPRSSRAPASCGTSSTATCGTASPTPATTSRRCSMHAEFDGRPLTHAEARIFCLSLLVAGQRDHAPPAVGRAARALGAPGAAGRARGRPGARPRARWRSASGGSRRSRRSGGPSTADDGRRRRAAAGRRVRDHAVRVGEPRRGRVRTDRRPRST